MMVALLVLGGQAAGETPNPSTPAAFIAAIEAAHGRDVFDSKQAIAMDYEGVWGGAKTNKARFVIARDTSRVRAEYDDGTLVVWDGSEAWVSPTNSPLQAARFHILTWPYFLLAPMKLGDPGSHLALLGTKSLQGNEFDAGKLTFDAGIGDAPDDWYLVYRDPRSSRLKAMAYIVTYFASVADAEKEVHAITYDDFLTVEGVTFSTRWRFWNWSTEKGIHGDPIGEARVSNLRFLTPTPDTFRAPPDARPDPKPKP